MSSLGKGGCANSWKDEGAGNRLGVTRIEGVQDVLPDNRIPRQRRVLGEVERALVLYHDVGGIGRMELTRRIGNNQLVVPSHDRRVGHPGHGVHAVAVELGQEG